MRTKNTQVRLASRPTGLPDESSFPITEEPVPELRDGEVLVRNHFLSVAAFDPSPCDQARSCYGSRCDPATPASCTVNGLGTFSAMVSLDSEGKLALKSKLEWTSQRHFYAVVRRGSGTATSAPLKLTVSMSENNGQ